MPRVAAAAALFALLAASLSGAAWSGAAEGEYLVGYDPADADVARAAIALSGGTIERESPELGFAVVRTNDPDRLQLLADSSPHIEYVETNDATWIDGGQWNGGQWNGAQWNGAQWNGGNGTAASGTARNGTRTISRT